MVAVLLEWLSQRELLPQVVYANASNSRVAR